MGWARGAERRGVHVGVGVRRLGWTHQVDVLLPEPQRGATHVRREDHKLRQGTATGGADQLLVCGHLDARNDRAKKNAGAHIAIIFGDAGAHGSYPNAARVAAANRAGLDRTDRRNRVELVLDVGLGATERPVECDLVLSWQP